MQIKASVTFDLTLTSQLEISTLLGDGACAILTEMFANKMHGSLYIHSVDEIIKISDIPIIRANITTSFNISITALVTGAKYILGEIVFVTVVFPKGADNNIYRIHENTVFTSIELDAMGLKEGDVIPAQISSKTEYNKGTLSNIRNQIDYFDTTVFLSMENLTNHRSISIIKDVLNRITKITKEYKELKDKKCRDKYAKLIKVVDTKYYQSLIPKLSKSTVIDVSDEKTSMKHFQTAFTSKVVFIHPSENKMHHLVTVDRKHFNSSLQTKSLKLTKNINLSEIAATSEFYSGNDNDFLLNQDSTCVTKPIDIIIINHLFRVINYLETIIKLTTSYSDKYSKISSLVSNI